MDEKVVLFMKERLGLWLWLRGSSNLSARFTRIVLDDDMAATAKLL